MHSKAIVLSAAAVMAIGLVWWGTRRTEAGPGQALIYVGCVRQLDANAGSHLQAIVNKSREDQIVVTTEDSAFKELLNTAFLWGTTIEVSYTEGTPNVLTRVKLDKFYTDPCDLAPKRPGTPK